MRAVVDANVFVSALIVDLGAPWRVIASWTRGEFDLVTSPDLLAELEDVLGRPSISRRLSSPPNELLQRIADTALAVSPAERIHVIVDDPSDNRLLEAAMAGAADFIVSGDRHLLSLGSYAGVDIVPPARFAAILAAQRGS